MFLMIVHQYQFVLQLKGDLPPIKAKDTIIIKQKNQKREEKSKRKQGMLKEENYTLAYSPFPDS